MKRLILILLLLPLLAWSQIPYRDIIIDPAQSFDGVIDPAQSFDIVRTWTPADAFDHFWLSDYSVTSTPQVSHWVDILTGSTVDLAQATGTFQPELIADQLNGLPGIVFNAAGEGNDNYLQGAFPANHAQPNTVIIVCTEPTDEGGAKNMTDGDETAKRHSIYQQGISNFYGMTAGAVDVSTLGIVGGNPFRIFTAIFNGASSELFRNGVSGGVKNNGVQSFDGLTLGARWDGAQNSDFTVMALGVAFSELPLSTIQRIENWLNSYYGGIY